MAPKGPNNIDESSPEESISHLELPQGINPMQLLHALMQEDALKFGCLRETLGSAAENRLNELDPALSNRLRQGLPTLLVTALEPEVPKGLECKVDPQSQQLYIGQTPIDAHLLIPGADMGEMLLQRLAEHPHDAAQLITNLMQYHWARQHQPRQAGQPATPRQAPHRAPKQSETQIDINTLLTATAVVVMGIIAGDFIYDIYKKRPPLPPAPTATARAKPQKQRPKSPHYNEKEATANLEEDEYPGSFEKDAQKKPRLPDELDLLRTGHTQYEQILALTLETIDPNTTAVREGLLDTYEAAKHFFGNKFIYRGIHAYQATLNDGLSMAPPYTNSEDRQMYPNQRVHRFTMIGSRSGFYRNKYEANRNLHSTVADAINHLLDYQNMSDDQIKQWIMWTYKHSFGADLRFSQIVIQRRNNKQVKAVLYRGTLEKAVVSEFEPIKGRAAGTRHSTQIRRKNRALIDDNGRLLLPSGISSRNGVSSHDILVPSSLLPAKKSFDLEFKGARGEGLKWPIDSDLLARVAHDFLAARRRNGGELVMGKSRSGKEIGLHSSRKGIFLNSYTVKTLTDFIVRGARSDYEKAKRISYFIQMQDYKSEVDRDEDRPIVFVLFNNGGDCNNKVSPWASMMASQKLDFCIFYLNNPNSEDFESHVVGGVGASTFAGGKIPGSMSHYNGYAPIELTERGWTIGNERALRGFEIIGMHAFTYKADSNGNGGSYKVEKWERSDPQHFNVSHVETVRVR